MFFLSSSVCRSDRNSLQGKAGLCTLRIYDGDEFEDDEAPEDDWVDVLAELVEQEPITQAEGMADGFHLETREHEDEDKEMPLVTWPGRLVSRDLALSSISLRLGRAQVRAR
jgi:hypothetical protein